MQAIPIFDQPGDSFPDSKEHPATSLSQKAYEQIRRRIVDLELPPGSILDEGYLQSELNLGRTPIREALLRLSMERLVTIVPRRGIFVAEIGITDLQQIFEVRISLEELAARLAARRGSPAHWERMEQLLTSVALGSVDYPEYGRTIDEGFHQILYEAANNRLLQDTLTILYTLSRRMWRYLSVSPADLTSRLEEHHAILDVLRQKDADRAGSLLVAHIRSFQELIQAALSGVPFT